MSSLARRAEHLVDGWPSGALVVGVLPAASDAEWSGRAALELSRAAADDRLTTWTLDLAPGASDLASRFGADRDPGLTEVAAGDAELSDVLHRDQWSGAHYLPGDVRILGTKSTGAKCVRTLRERIPGRESALLVLMEPKAADAAASAGWLDGVVRLAREDDDVDGGHPALAEVTDLGRLARPVEQEEAEEAEDASESRPADDRSEPAADAAEEPLEAERTEEPAPADASPGADGTAGSGGRRVAEPAGEPDIVVEAEPAADPPVEAARSPARRRKSGEPPSEDGDAPPERAAADEPAAIEEPTEDEEPEPREPVEASDSDEPAKSEEPKEEPRAAEAGEPVAPDGSPATDDSDGDSGVLEVPDDLWESRATSAPGEPADPEPASSGPSHENAGGPFATRPFAEPDELSEDESAVSGEPRESDDGAGGEDGIWSWLLDRLPWKPWESSDEDESGEGDEAEEVDEPGEPVEAPALETVPSEPAEEAVEEVSETPPPDPAAAAKVEAVDAETGGEAAPEDPAEADGPDDAAATATGRELTVYRRPTVPARPAAEGPAAARSAGDQQRRESEGTSPASEPAASRALEASAEVLRLPPAREPEAPAEAASESAALPVPAASVEPASPDEAERAAEAAEPEEGTEPRQVDSPTNTDEQSEGPEEDEGALAPPAAAEQVDVGPEREGQEDTEHAPDPEEEPTEAVRALAADAVTSRREDSRGPADAPDDPEPEVLEESAVVVEVPGERWRPRAAEPEDEAAADEPAASDESDPAELISPGRWTPSEETDERREPELPAAPADPGRFAASAGPATANEPRTSDVKSAIRAASWSAPEWVDASGEEPSDDDGKAASGAPDLVHGAGVAGQWTVRPEKEGAAADRPEPPREPEGPEEPRDREEPEEPETADFITFDRGMPSEWADEEEPEDSGPADFISQDVGVPGQGVDRNSREAKTRSRPSSASMSSMSGSPREERLERERHERGARGGRSRGATRPESRTSQFRRRDSGLPGRLGRWLAAAVLAAAVGLGAAAALDGVGPGDVPEVAGTAAAGLTQGVASFLGDLGPAGDDSGEEEESEPPARDGGEASGESSGSSAAPGPEQPPQSGGGERTASGGAVIPASAGASRPAADEAGNSSGDAAFGALSDALARSIGRYYREEERYRSGSADCSALMRARERADSLYVRLSLYRLADDPGLSPAAESALEERDRQIEALSRSYGATGCPRSQEP